MAKDLDKQTYLVVDDSAIMIRIMQNCLSKCGVGPDQICSVSSAEDAYALLQDEQKHFDCVLADWNMPGMDGIQLLASMRKMERYKNTPFILITSEAKKEDIVEAIKAGVDGYVVKPVTPEGLRQKIEDALS